MGEREIVNVKTFSNQLIETKFNWISFSERMFIMYFAFCSLWSCLIYDLIFLSFISFSNSFIFIRIYIQPNEIQNSSNGWHGWRIKQGAISEKLHTLWQSKFQTRHANANANEIRQILFGCIVVLYCVVSYLSWIKLFMHLWIINGF